MTATGTTTADRLYRRAAEFYPICRSITGAGTFATLQRIQQEIPITIQELKSGTPVLDWIVPDEWVVETATLYAPDGGLVCDLTRHSLELLNYSTGYQGKVSLAELQPHLHSLPGQPGLIPYKTSYYARTWGFCLPDQVRRGLPDGSYQVDIRAQHVAGKLVWGELLFPGESRDEILLTTHICHPSLANDNCSGMSLLTELARQLADRPSHYYSVRLLFLPGTIGAICWLAQHAEHARRHIRGGLVIANVGDRGGFHYKQTRSGAALPDRAVEQLNLESPGRITVRDFSPYGYDERQFASPGFGLAVGSLTRTPYAQFPEYHTSADNLEFISGESLAGSLELYAELLGMIDTSRCWRNLSPDGEPMLGRRGLYRSMGGHTETDTKAQEMAILWLLNQSDGTNDLLAIAKRAGLPYQTILTACERLRRAGLLAAERLPGHFE